MKTIDKLLNGRWLQRLTLFVVSMICVVGSVQASETYYYTYKVVPTTGGKVYASDDESSSIVWKQNTYTDSGQKGGKDGFAEQTFYYYANPKPDYTFLGWKKNGTGDFVNNSAFFTTTEKITGGYFKPTEISYTAYFEINKGLVKVESTDATKGTVSISNPNNTTGDRITITASPDISKGVVFLGWKTSNSATAPYVTTDNPYSLTVNGSATYYAFFSDPATSVYCILKNCDTGEYLCLSGNGQAEMHTEPVTYNNYTTNVEDGCYFNEGLRTISSLEAVNNPLIVFKHVSTNADGKILGDLVSDVKMVESQGSLPTQISTQYLIGNNGYPLIFSLSPKYPNAYRIYSHLTRSIRTGRNTYTPVQFDTYLCDDRREYISLKPFQDLSEAEGIDWEIVNLTEGQIVGAFGANANAKYTKTKNGKYYYYTSMFTPFAYKLLDGVNAYYLNPDEDNYNEVTNTLALSEISSGKVVPANMAVIIECNSADNPTQNRLLPVAEYTISDDDRAEYAKNLLVGYNQLYDRNNYSYEYNQKYQTVTNNHDYMYIFSMKNNDLGFYHYSGTTIPKNKAYLNLPHTWEEIKEDLLPNGNSNPVKLNFGHQTVDEDLNSISLFNDVVDDDADLPIYNLQGVQVMNPEKGVYIRGGKKYLVK